MKIILIPRIIYDICEQLYNDIETANKTVLHPYGMNTFFISSDNTQRSLAINQLLGRICRSAYFIGIELDDAKHIQSLMLNHDSSAYRQLYSLIKEAESDHSFLTEIDVVPELKLVSPK